jgi:PhnB protein
MPDVKPVPEGYHTVTPYQIIARTVRGLDFYKKTFGTTELMRMEAPDGRIGQIDLLDSTASAEDLRPRSTFCAKPSRIDSNEKIGTRRRRLRCVFR